MPFGDRVAETARRVRVAYDVHIREAGIPQLVRNIIVRALRADPDDPADIPEPLFAPGIVIMPQHHFAVFGAVHNHIRPQHHAQLIERAQRADAGDFRQLAQRFEKARHVQNLAAMPRERFGKPPRSNHPRP